MYFFNKVQFNILKYSVDSTSNTNKDQVIHANFSFNKLRQAEHTDNQTPEDT